MDTEVLSDNGTRYCDECVYYDQLFLWLPDLHNFDWTDYGLCTHPDVCRPVLCWKEACRRFAEQDFWDKFEKYYGLNT